MENLLRKKADWVRSETLKIHKISKEIRLASSLSPVEILTVLYYGGIIKFNSQKPFWESRDRFIISKGHGSISFYPILADLKFINSEELLKVCQDAALLGGIPDCSIPGYETINGSLGHGLGVADGIALGLKTKKRKEKVFVLVGDGELYEGSVWEAVMFATQHRLGNLIAIIDNNYTCMLDRCKNVMDLEPIEEKFRTFGWEVKKVDGHDVKMLYNSLNKFKDVAGNGKPKVLIADTVKGKGVLRLESDPLSHVKNLTNEEIDILLNT